MALDGACLLIKSHWCWQARHSPVPGSICTSHLRQQHDVKSCSKAKHSTAQHCTAPDSTAPLLGAAITSLHIPLLGRHGSASLCGDGQENIMAATYNVLAFKRWYFTWWSILYVQKHLDLLSGVAPSTVARRLLEIVTKVTNLETVKIEFRHLRFLLSFFLSSFCSAPSAFTQAVPRPKHPRTVEKFSWQVPFELSF